MKRSSHSHLPYATLTHQGLVREHNEDSMAITAFAPVSELIPESLFCVLCDGVGGHLGGETASKMSTELITHYIEETDATAPVVQMANAIQFASDEVWRSAQSSSEVRGMATTAVCAWVIGKRLFVANVGDSRIYLIRRGKIRQITVDHTWLQDAFESGRVNREAFKGHPNAHVIKRYIGSETPPEVDLRLNWSEGSNRNQQGMTIETGDILFMCSDGVSDLVLENELVLLLKSDALESALEAIKALIFQRGANDNLTMIAVKIPSANPPTTQRARVLRLLVFALILLAASFAGIYLGWLALYSSR